MSDRNEGLDAALAALGRIDHALDLRWLREELRARLDSHYDAKLHGIPGGHDAYSRSEALEAAFDAATRLSVADLHSLELVVDMLYRLMSPVGEARGSVQLKTIVKHYKVIDWAATGNGLPVFVLDENGAPVTEAFSFTYAYVRQYASKADANRKGAKLLSLYADRGMGKGGSGGYVAAALSAELVTQDEILDAWHAGQATYQPFIDECTKRLHTSGLGQDEILPNSSEK